MLEEWQKKLIDTVEDDVCKRLKQSLNQQKLLDLEFRNFQNINSAKTSYLKIFPELKGSFIEIFKKHQKIILLGDPGAGKTTELLQLAKTLLANIDDNDEPIPVIFELTTWEPYQKIETWLVERLEIKYKIPEHIGKELLNNGKILPLLDGLNEQDDNLEKCLASIKSFVHDSQERQYSYEQPLLVCCRLRDFEKNNKDNNFDSFIPIVIKRLSKEKIIKYFEAAKRQDLLKLFNRHNSLFQNVNLPLDLKIIVEAYHSTKVEEYLNDKQSSFHEVVQALRGEREIYLKKILRDYINYNLFEINNFQEENKENPRREKDIKNSIAKIKKQRIKQKLSWLAKTMLEHKQKEFLIENIQPTWLEKTHQKWLYRICFGVISGLILAIFSAFLSILIYQLFSHIIADQIISSLSVPVAPEVAGRIKESVINVIIGINSGLISGLISVVVYGEVNQVLFFEQFQLSWQRIVSFWSNIPRLIIFMIVIFMSLPERIPAMVFKSIYFYSNFNCQKKCPELNTDFHVNIDVFFIILLITLFLSHLPFSIATNQTKNRTYPNQGIITSLLNAGTITLINSLWMTFIYVALCHFILQM